MLHMRYKAVREEPPLKGEPILFKDREEVILTPS